MKEDEWIQRAILYFNGSLSSDEEARFLKETEASEPLSELMSLWKQTEQQAAAFERHRKSAEDFIETHARIKSGFVVHSAKPSLKVWRWVAAAALATGVFFFIRALLPSAKSGVTSVVETIKRDSVGASNNQPDQRSDTIKLELLFAQSFAPDEVPIDQSGPLEDAYFYYSSKQYQKAIAAIDSADARKLTRGISSSPLYFYAVYYKGLSLLSIGNAKEAIPLLNKASTLAGSPEQRSKTNWYLSLAHLKAGNRSSAVEYLNLVKNNSLANAYRTKAENLLRALND